MPQTYRVFLAGIMQGSLLRAMHEQGYRDEIRDLLHAHLPDAEIYDPLVAHPDSLAYDGETGRDVFFDLMDRAGQCDILIAFLPEASMGTAIEMWNAYHAGAYILCVSPLVENWVVRFLADAVVPDLEGLTAFLRDGRLETNLREKVGFVE